MIYRLARVLVPALLVFALAGPAWGWGRGHGLIRTWAVARLPQCQRDWIGVLCHWNEDPGCPSAHSSPVTEDALRTLIPPPPDKQRLNYLYGYGGIADVGRYSIAEEPYQPQLLGSTVAEAAARIYQHQRLLERRAAGYIVPLVQDMVHGDGVKAVAAD